jgi:hypothetical protein
MLSELKEFAGLLWQFNIVLAVARSFAPSLLQSE